jgi:hypothetical protein
LGFRESVERCIADVDHAYIKGRRRSAFYIPRDIKQEDLLVQDLVRHVRKDMIVREVVDF